MVTWTITRIFPNLFKMGCMILRRIFRSRGSHPTLLNRPLIIIQYTRSFRKNIPSCCFTVRSEHYWWRGQNKRTYQVGAFPRNIVDPQRRMCPEDISRPLKNSFIHTGHADGSGKTWGNPETIDEYVRIACFFFFMNG